jgi:hypothetical protein
MHALTFPIGIAMPCFHPCFDSTILAEQCTIRPDSVSLQDVAKFCQEGKLVCGTLKKVPPKKVDAHSIVPLQERASYEVLGQTPPGLVLNSSRTSSCGWWVASTQTRRHRGCPAIMWMIRWMILTASSRSRKVRASRKTS